jgi:putative transposase
LARGYAAFTVSPPARPAIKKYIANQEAHHKTQSYRDELIAMLRRAGVEYDPRYLD